ncbi:MAG TPA: ABC transporter substrate-binding protein [Chloroflexota bacterium]|nr:ABC transporter substrate-binding protein [Chloroflexota bacterium]
MTNLRHRTAWLACLLTVAACAPSAAPGTLGRSPAAPSPSAVPIQRTLVMLARGEPPSIAAKPLQAFSGSLLGPIRMFNGTLDYMDDTEGIHPYQAEALPQLNTDSWQVFPDGTMQTTYHLRPNLSWHDGQPLTAADFVFGWQVYSTPELGASAGAPIGQMAEVLAPDRDTVVIKWRRLYPDAAGLDMGFQALPAHILRGSLRQLDPEAFVNLPFWTREYVGSGPYRITEWTPGSAIEASAFEGHALGKPKIDQVRIMFVSDPNTAIALMLTGEAQFAHDWVFFYEEAATLEQEARARNVDIVLDYAPSLLRLTGIQHRPDTVSPRALVDVRVRRAIAWGIDAQAAVDAVTGGHGLATSTITSPRSRMFKAVEGLSPPPRYDPRMVQQLLEEAGLTRGPQGFFQEPGGEPFRVEYATDGGPSPERENAIYVDSLRQAGVDVFSYVIPVAQLRDLQARALRPGLTMGGFGGKALSLFTSAEIPRPENRWAGQNRAGWSSPEYDRVWQAFDTSLDPADREQYTAQMERLIYEDVGAIPTMFMVVVNARAGNLQGPKVRQTPDAANGAFNTYLWEWTR